MAIPSGGYDTATITNPTSALTDFTLIVDLSRMSTDWWAAVNTSDGTRGRASKDDGITELACDWIDFNDTAETGILRVKWSGTLASSGTQVIRIYPPNTANTAYGVSDTFGQYNAYDSSWEGYYPVYGDSGTILTDRTSNLQNGTLNAGVAFVDNELDFSVDTATTDVMTEKALDGASVFSVSTYVRFDSISGNKRFIVFDTFALNEPVIIWSNDGSLFSLVTTSGGSTSVWDVGFAFSVLTDYKVDLTYDGSSVSVYVDGAFINSFALTGTLVNTDDAKYKLGFNSSGILGQMWDAKFKTINDSDSWISLEYSQTNDNATFWGTWTWNSAGGGFTLTADAGTFTTTGQDSSLLFDRIVSAESGAFTTTGQDAGLFTARVLTADGGSYATVGQDANLTLGTNIILSAEAGTFSVTGQDATLIHNKILNGETGEFSLSGQPASLIWSGEDFYVQLLTIGSDIQSTLNLSSSIQSIIQLEGKI